MHRDEIELIGLEDKPTGLNVSDEDSQDWKKKMIKAKTATILALDTGPLPKMSVIIDDDNRFAKDLWEALGKVYST